MCVIIAAFSHMRLEDDEAGEDFWIPLSVIDFGDAKVGDPLWDLVPLHISCFRADKRLLRKFCQTYALFSCAAIMSH